mgnify:CR=1 FL=1
MTKGFKMKYKSKLKRTSKYNPHSKRFINHAMLSNPVSIENCEDKMAYRTINKARQAKKKKDHSKLKKIWSKTWHIMLSFLLGVAITTVVHMILSNQRVRTTAEAVCTVFGRDEQECKNGIDDVLDMADQVTQNNANIKGE